MVIRELNQHTIASTNSPSQLSRAAVKRDKLFANLSARDYPIRTEKQVLERKNTLNQRTIATEERRRTPTHYPTFHIRSDQYLRTENSNQTKSRCRIKIRNKQQQYIHPNYVITIDSGLFLRLS